MVDDTLDVTTVTAEVRLPVGLVGSIGSGVIRRVSVRETVREDQINHIGSGKALPGGRAALPSGNFVRILEGLGTVGEDQVICAGLRRRGYLHVDEKIIRAVRFVDSGDFDTLPAGELDVVKGGDAVTPYQKLQRGFHADPPAEGLDPHYVRSRSIRYGRNIHLRGIAAG